MSAQRVSRRVLLGSLAVLLLAPRAVLAADARRVYIQPLGAALPDAHAALVEQALSAFYRVEVKVLPRVELPKIAYYRKRRRYRAEKLLDFLAARIPEDGHRILGLTGADISTSKGKIEDWGILGLATIDGKACVISSFRCKRRAKNAARVAQRLAKVAVHEIGHTFGLEHCPNPGCIMEDAGGKMETTDTEYDLCPESRQKLIDHGYELANGEIPWPKP